MKKHFLHLAMVLLAAVTLPLTSCNDKEEEGPQNPTPNFPAVITPTIEAGGTYTLRLEPNQSWSVSVPTETAQWFWIQDGTQKVYSKSGSAGEVEVVIGTTDDEDFDEAPTCVVSMTMNGQTEVIARITKGIIERELTVKEALVEEGMFVPDPESSLTYKYGEATKAVNLISFNDNAFYLMHILVEANYDWVLIDYPEWLAEPEVLTGNADAATPVYLTSNLQKLPLEDASGKLVFAASSNLDATVEVDITIPGSKDIFQLVDGNQKMFFSDKGLYNQTDDIWVDATGKGRVLSPEGYAFYIFAEINEMFGSYMSDEPQDIDWMVFSESVEDPDAVVQTVNFTVGVKENTQNEVRKGFIWALPPAIAATIKESWEVPNNPDYDQYIVAEIEQRGAQGPISEYIYGSLDGAKTGFGFTRLTGDEDYFLYFEDISGLENIEYAYELVYTAQPVDDRSVGLLSDRKITSVQYTDFYGDPIWGTPWVDLREVVFSDAITGETTDGFVIDMTAPQFGINQGLVILSDDSGIFAVIVCIYNPNHQFVEELFEPTLSELTEGMTLVEITKENYAEVIGNSDKIDLVLDREWLNYTCPLYWLKQTVETVDYPLLSINVPYIGASVTPYSESEDAGGWLGTSSYGDYLSVNMNKPGEGYLPVAMLQFIDSSYSMVGIVFCDPDW